MQYLISHTRYGYLGALRCIILGTKNLFCPVLSSMSEYVFNMMEDCNPSQDFIANVGEMSMLSEVRMTCNLILCTGWKN